MLGVNYMEIITNKINHDLNINKYIKDTNSCFLDIETTGLNRRTKIIYLIGVLYYDLELKSWVLKQYFANTFEKEADLLDIFIKEISSFNTIITYNGDSFDIPFINHRLKHHNINGFINKEKSFDIYRIIRKNKHYLNLENLKLKTVEESLGFYREDKYSGFECIGFYYEYVRTSALDLKENILKHNYDDLVYMLDIIQILDVIDDKKSIYLNFNSKNSKLTISDFQFSNDMLKVSIYTDIPFRKNIKYFSRDYSITSKNFIHLYLSIDIKYAYVSEDKICAYVDKNKYPNIITNKLTQYKIPSNIYILMVEKEYYIENIKGLLKSILEELVYEEIIK